MRAIGITERYVTEVDRSAALHQWRRFRVIAQLVRLQQGCHRFRQAREMLGDVDQGNSKVTRSAEDGNAERIEDIMREISRWYNIDVKYEGKITSEVFYGRVARNMNINEVLRILERSNSVYFKIEGRRVTVLSR